MYVIGRHTMEVLPMNDFFKPRKKSAVNCGPSILKDARIVPKGLARVVPGIRHTANARAREN